MPRRFYTHALKARAGAPVRRAPVVPDNHSDDSDDDVAADQAAELDAGLGPAARQWSCAVDSAFKRAKELAGSDSPPRLLAAIRQYSRVEKG